MRCIPPRFDKVVEALMCLFPEKVKEKSVSFSQVSKEGRQNIPGGATCRQSSAESWATLIDHHCVVEDYDGAGKVCSHSTKNMRNSLHA